MKYEIAAKTNVVKIWTQNEPTADEKPLIRQPQWPDGTAWASKAEASAWAEAYIANMTDPDYGFMPGNSPAEPLIAKPTTDAV